MTNMLIVGIGGFLGAIMRYILTLVIKLDSNFPIATFTINMIGTFAIGIISAFAIKFSSFNLQLLLFLRVGICGGFTSFSAYTLESLGLIQQGKAFTMILYTVCTVTLGILMTFFGESIINN